MTVSNTIQCADEFDEDSVLQTPIMKRLGGPSASATKFITNTSKLSASDVESRKISVKSLETRKRQATAQDDEDYKPHPEVSSSYRCCTMEPTDVMISQDVISAENFEVSCQRLLISCQNQAENLSIMGYTNAYFSELWYLIICDVVFFNFMLNRRRGAVEQMQSPDLDPALTKAAKNKLVCLSWLPDDYFPS
jgi:hypothetical protein